MYVFCDDRTRPTFDQAARLAGLRLRTGLIWDKGSIGLGSGWRAQHEHICWYQKGHPSQARNDLGTILHAKRPRGYPTEKPVTVIQELIKQSTGPGQTILDPFTGSGSTGRAARILGRHAILIDINTTTAEQRLHITSKRHANAS